MKRQLRWTALALTLVCLFGITGCTESAPVLYPTDNAVECHELTLCYAKQNYYSYAQVAEKAAIIVEADVIEHFRIDEDSAIRCYAMLKVRQSLKGDLKKGDTFYSTENGYMYYGGTGGTADGGPLMEKGNRMVLFLNESDAVTANGEPMYAISTLGKYFLDSDGKYHCSKSYNENYPHISISPRLNDPKPKTLKELKELIASAEAVSQREFEIYDELSPF